MFIFPLFYYFHFFAFSFKFRFFNSLNLILTSLSTGGLKSYDISLLNDYGKLILVFAMIFGATNIGIFLFKHQIQKIAFIEFIVLLLVISFIFSVFKISNFPIDNLFHITSILTTTGHSYIQLNLSEIQIFVFSILLLIGGSLLSTAGGIKIFRFLKTIKMFFVTLKDLILNKKEQIEIKEFYAFSYFFIYLLTFIFSVLIFMFYGFDLKNSIFNSSSCLANMGILFEVKNVPWHFQIFLSLLIILARVELLPIFSFFIK